MADEKYVKRKTKIVMGTRGSALAQWQANYVLAALKHIASDLEIAIQIIKTTGDKDQTRSLADLGELGVFTKEIENALHTHEIDLAVHSLKDLPTETADGLLIAAIPARADPRDCIVSRHGVGLMQLPHGARIGTSSARRTAQLLALRPDVQIVPLRGNVDTRLRKAQTEEYDAVVLAAAGITRLGRASEITEYLSLDSFLPDPGQGALAIEIRADDAELAALVTQLDDASTRAAVTAERAFLRALGGGCRMPIGAYAKMQNDELHLRGLIASDDGSQITRGEISGAMIRAEELGVALATQLQRADKNPITRDPSPLPHLHGRKILITRAREQASALAEKIRALGGEPIEFPTIDFASLEDFRELDNALARVREFDWVIFTSANGVRFVADRLGALDVNATIFSMAKIAAIGPATASALAQLGLRVDFVPTKYLGEQIAIELPIEREQRALLLRADIASDVLEQKLIERGIVVTNIDAYRTITPANATVDLSAIDAVTFTSSSTVRHFVTMLNGNVNALLEYAAVFCIGPVTADTARELGLRVDAVAAEHTVDGLVSTMVEFYLRPVRFASRKPDRSTEDNMLEQQLKLAPTMESTTHFPRVRPRRTRRTENLRALVRETEVNVRDFIYPLFVVHGTNVREEINSMPGVYHQSLDVLAHEIEEVSKLGIPGVILFGLPAAKDELGSEDYADHGIVQEAIRVCKRIDPDLIVATDVCMCQYTSHGHCGIVRDGMIDNDETLKYLGMTAVSHAVAGADIVAPSAMMDGQVGAIRSALDAQGFTDTAILAYASKYASSFYGPFREAADSPPQFGDRRQYQMDTANAREALREVALDIEEGADMVMIKPALAYLDIIRRVHDGCDLPVAAYNVSGEYSMVKAAARNGWLDEKKVTLEILTAIKRAGARMILTYHAKQAAQWLGEKP